MTHFEAFVQSIDNLRTVDGSGDPSSPRIHEFLQSLLSVRTCKEFVALRKRLFPDEKELQQVKDAIPVLEKNLEEIDDWFPRVIRIGAVPDPESDYV